ncbi:CDP-alcohol phosphatidyltransferase family protein [Ectothiorhodospira marina]|uniref:CDP-diacylglycerol--glycerol-3-phosphate 3-phosphatidyltransferase n=1 Tax=Ectothiorhodospira marina TaxID=1396821 RepID=A0A1H7L5S9_9GAMM|nr:CDP-alcohol phosphatidyltransferase family protein [Ectothiorhodospira marina]SEK94389.1 cardiolipin synthase [Ectothiorhodospira marina]
MSLRQLPNTITLLRIALTVPIIWALLAEAYGLVLGLLLLAGLSDALDGWLVRRYGWYTRLGGYLDPLADKVLVVSTYFTVAWTGLLPWWLVVLVVAREVIILSGALAFRAVTRSLEMQPLFISKVNTFMQIVLVLSVIVSAGVFSLPAWYLEGLLVLVLLTTVSSGLAYVVAWTRKAFHHGRATVDPPR